MVDIDLTATPRVVTRDVPLPLSDIDAAHCGPDGVYIFKGSQYYHYESPMIMAMSKIAPVPQDITSEMMGCEDQESGMRGYFTVICPANITERQHFHPPPLQRK